MEDNLRSRHLKNYARDVGSIREVLIWRDYKRSWTCNSKRIVDKFGEETIPVLKFEPERLAHIRGISLNKAQEISDEFNENGIYGKL